MLCFHGLFADFFKSRGPGDERVKFLEKKGGTFFNNRGGEMGRRHFGK